MARPSGCWPRRRPALQAWPSRLSSSSWPLPRLPPSLAACCKSARCVGRLTGDVFTAWAALPALSWVHRPCGYITDPARVLLSVLFCITSLRHQPQLLQADCLLVILWVQCEEQLTPEAIVAAPVDQLRGSGLSQRKVRPQRSRTHAAAALSLRWLALDHLLSCVPVPNPPCSALCESWILPAWPGGVSAGPLPPLPGGPPFR